MFPQLATTLLLFATLTNSLSVKSVTQSQDFPLGSEVENLALRPSGSIIALTYTLIPSIWSVSLTPNSAPKRLHTFPHATGVSSIAYSTIPDQYFLITGNFSFATFEPTPNSYTIHRLSFDKRTDEPIIEDLAPLDGIQQPNGMIHVPGTPDVLIADCRGGFVYRFNTETLALTTYFDDPLLKPLASSAPVLFGVNGIKLSRGFFYFSNTNQQIIARVPVSGPNAALVGTAVVIVKETPIDDFIVDEGNGDLYLAENGGNELGFVKGESFAVNGTVPETILGGGSSTALLEPSAVIWAKGEEGWTLVVTNSGPESQFLPNATFVGGGRITVVHLDC